jgi:hypothetical protein
MKTRILFAAGLYFLIVFAVGFLLGPIRVLLLEPRIGGLAAELCEAPFLLAAIVIAARTVPRMTRVLPDPRAWWAIGLGALVMQQVADLIVGQALRGISVGEQIDRFATPEGAVYAALLVAFAIMPALVNHRRR